MVGYKGPKNWDEQKTLIDHPLLGSYRSADPRLLDFQFSLAQAAGIDGFIVSWSGAESVPGKIFKQMLEQLSKSPYRGFRLCVVIEVVANTPDVSEEKLMAAIGSVVKSYGRHPAYLRVDGKPVVFVYLPNHKSVERWRAIRQAVARERGQAVYVAVPDGWDMDLAYLAVFDSIGPTRTSITRTPT